jgi:hypothetical protein
MAIYNVELRKRTGSTYGDKILVATHKTLVEGLLGEDGKILENLIPNSVFGGLRFIGYASGTTHDTTAELKTLVDAAVASNGGTARGAFFIYGGASLTITVSLGHQVMTEVGLRAQDDTFELNSGDWIIATNEDGTQWAVVNNTYNNATTSVAGLMSAADKTKLDGLSNYNHPTGGANVNLTVDDDHKIASIVVNSLGHVTAVTTEAIRTATTSLQGLMSAADKTKLDGIATGANKYTHPTHSAAELTFTNREVMGAITVDEEGHVTWVQKRSLDLASTSTSGLVELATNAEAQTGTDNTRAVTPAGLGHVLGYALGFPIFEDLTEANAAAVAGTYKDGSYAFVQV